MISGRDSWTLHVLVLSCYALCHLVVWKPSVCQTRGTFTVSRRLSELELGVLKLGTIGESVLYASRSLSSSRQALGAPPYDCSQTNRHLDFVRGPVSVAPQTQPAPWRRPFTRFLQLDPKICKAAVHCREHRVPVPIRHANRVDESPSHAFWRLDPVHVPVVTLLLRTRLSVATRVIVAPAFEVLPQSLEQAFGHGEEVQIGRHCVVGFAPLCRC